MAIVARGDGLLVAGRGGVHVLQRKIRDGLAPDGEQGGGKKGSQGGEEEGASGSHDRSDACGGTPSLPQVASGCKQRIEYLQRSFGAESEPRTTDADRSEGPRRASAH